MVLKKYINFRHRFPLAKLLYPVCSPLWNGFSRVPTLTESRKILEDFFPDCGQGPRCAKKSLPEIEYDLLIVVAAYNVAPFLAECLDSILSQRTSYRILVRVVNDASSDATAEVLARYERNPMVEIINHHENQGLSAARNSALEHLNATYICNVDGDDILAPGALRLWLDKAFSTGADIVANGIVRFNSDTGAPIFTLSPEEADNVASGEVCGMPTIFLYRREFFQDTVYPLGYWYEDVIFELLFFPKAKKIASAGGAHYLYRMRSGSITQNHNSPRNLGSLYGGAKSIECSFDAGCWLNQTQRSYLTSLCAHIIRISYSRFLALPPRVRKSAMVYWQPVVKRILTFADEADKTDSALFNAIAAGDYAAYELNCIEHHKWS